MSYLKAKVFIFPEVLSDLQKRIVDKVTKKFQIGLTYFCKNTVIKFTREKIYRLFQIGFSIVKKLTKKGENFLGPGSHVPG